MTSLALALVLIAAFTHATWNYLAKRAGGAPAFVFLFTLFNALLYLPVAVWWLLVKNPVIEAPQLIFMLGSAVFHTFYFSLLMRGYRLGDLSLVYPLARCTGPLLSATVAIIVFGERPTILAMFGGAMILGGAMFMAGPPRKILASGTGQALGYALLTGSLIACYTLWDKQAVSAFMVPPLLLDYGSNLGRLLLLIPYGMRHRRDIAQTWQDHRWRVLGVAFLAPLGYILVLTALTFSPVSYVAPAREISILIGTILGTRLLREGHGRRRLTAAAAMVAGTVALALG